MATLEDIRKRIGSVKNTQKITKAMKMVSAAKLRRSTEKAEASRPYETQLSEIVGRILREVEWSSELTEKRPIKKIALVIITSDKGLCGSLNSNLLKSVQRFILKNSAHSFTAFAFGKKAAEFCRRNNIEIARVETDLMKRANFEFTRSLADDLRSKFLGSEFDQVEVFFNEFKSALTQTPFNLTLLPFIPQAASEAEGEDLKSFIYEPAGESLLHSLIPMLIDFKLYRALMESFASEHAARMAAMDSATNNARDMIGRLTLQRNRARQAAITKELMEIIGGAEAISA